MMERRLKPSAKVLSRVRVAEIRANPYQPRALFDEESIRALARSIEENGLLSPLLLRRSAGDGYTLIAGERRLRALRVLGRSWVDAIVMEADEADMRALSLIENIQREQLTFLEEAQAMRELLRETGMTQDALARRLGRSPSSVANLLRLLRLPEAVRRAVGEEKLTERHARALLKLDGDEKAQLDAVRRITRGQLNVRQTDALIESFLRERRAASHKVKGVVRDARMFVNAISGTVEKLRKVGVNAALRVEETSESVEILVTLRKGMKEERKG